MSVHEQYRPPARTSRVGRLQTDNEVMEGLPVKQWGETVSRVSFAPASAQTTNREDEKWAEPPMPRDFQLLHPWTQQLLRLARSGKVGTKRKPHGDPHDEENHRLDEDLAKEITQPQLDDRGYLTKKWKPVPEHLLTPEHKHFEFLAKRRKGLPNLYGPDQLASPVVPMRRTKVQKVDENGQVAVYEVLVPEGQAIEGEVPPDSTDLADVPPVAAPAPGTVIEGVGVANDDGVVVAEHLKPAAVAAAGAPRRNRPPPKKKGGPGRGKKRVTFTNPDGSTYTTVVPNATKIVPQPGQTVKHVAKGEEATRDITAEEAAAAAASHAEDGSGSEDGEDGEDDDEDDDREEGELTDDNDGEAHPEATLPAPNGTQHADPMDDVQPTTTTTSPSRTRSPEQAMANPAPPTQSNADLIDATDPAAMDGIHPEAVVIPPAAADATDLLTAPEAGQNRSPGPQEPQSPLPPAAGPTDVVLSPAMADETNLPARSSPDVLPLGPSSTSREDETEAVAAVAAPSPLSPQELPSPPLAALPAAAANASLEGAVEAAPRDAAPLPPTEMVSHDNEFDEEDGSVLSEPPPILMGDEEEKALATGADPRGADRPGARTEHLDATDGDEAGDEDDGPAA